ncbi:hypothetical protein OESDEN_22443 [Oesophagostomum dentatum]|uniref:Uncharacterized protein n=1 Tax=Oesophagostomum dentatum TaxID=61180 RepID=A0A0B1S377_OESDE|nr:hypothetical protein OESDEN_22443 [Oesophagostomum dentatum]
MNGVGIVEAREGNNDDSDSFVSDNDSVADGDDAVMDPYAQYQALPMQVEEENEDDSEQNGCNDSVLADETLLASSLVSPPIRKEFEKLLQESASSKSTPEEVIPHQPVNISLDAEKIEAIRTAMSGFTLPPPPHMKNLDDQQLSAIIKEKLRSSRD